jgi:predicted MFS family arabinose efflux permease
MRSTVERAWRKLMARPQYAFLMLAIGNLVWVPFSVKFGKRPVLIVSMLVLLCSQIWAANVQSYGSLLGARMVSGFAASAGEVSHFVLVFWQASL